jgi:hypothetical protein
MLTITSILIVLGLLFGGTGAAVVASQDSLPGEALYPLKTATEEVQYRLTSGEEAKLELALRNAQRRFLELGIAEKNGEMFTNRTQIVWAERLEENLKDALLAAAALEEPEDGLTKIKRQVHIWDIVDYKQDRDRDGSYGGDDETTTRKMVKKMLNQTLVIVETALAAPAQFPAMLLGAYGAELENLDLLAISGEGDPLLVDPQGQGAGAQGVQSGTGEAQGYGPEEYPFGAQNLGDTPEFQDQNQGEGYGPAGEGVGNPDQPAAPGTQNQSGGGAQNQQGGKP